VLLWSLPECAIDAAIHHTESKALASKPLRLLARQAARRFVQRETGRPMRRVAGIRLPGAL